ncbi:tRNA (adenosine(37)-N6)-threonylcarbamoyltransferase complex dimerization subunit type 1 TsaB [Pelagovum pacificum]|uniref:tRNA (adenosine(37)-N6)-threonylcarbamoyltransferase complex dimerization subunit type 1 TsaB n=1 Tax=Pelagovum pacificum TaxID=2588711 RepID=UPI001E35E407|nr:tRNA (adenosine(37)-N6)-threonylcarbamoyltransferase complex dimerization subunit type 1 TsaB [Pelagovum pacificum]
MILAFDTSGPWIAAALGTPGDFRVVVEEMSRGQGERLLPLLEDLTGGDWNRIEKIGVGVGPGNFTGIRIAVAAARGLALGLGKPAIGIDGFEASARAAGRGGPVALPAPRGMVHLGGGGGAPRLVTEAEVPKDTIGAASPHDLVLAIGTLAAERAPGQRPAPLYVRPADAAPPSDPPPVILP